jgi:hypothetical protein
MRRIVTPEGTSDGVPAHQVAVCGRTSHAQRQRHTSALPVLIQLDAEDAPRSGPDAVARVKHWLSSQFHLPDDAAVMVSELRCREDGCPPLETILAILTPTGRWHRTIHRATADLTEADIVTVLDAEGSQVLGIPRRHLPDRT